MSIRDCNVSGGLGFAKSGFTKGCASKAKELGNVTMVSYGDIIRGQSKDAATV